LNNLASKNDSLHLRRSLSVRTIIGGWFLGVVLLAIIGWFDLVTGYEVYCFAFYLIPVALTAWRLSLGHGIAMSFLCAAVWMIADLSSGHTYTTPGALFWNTGMELILCLVIACAVAMIRRKIEIQRRLVSRLNTASDRIHRLQQTLLDDKAASERLFGRSPSR
jgi:hypothetical protein